MNSNRKLEYARVWNKKINMIIYKIGLVKCGLNNECALEKTLKMGVIIICLYVDNLLVKGNNES